MANKATRDALFLLHYPPTALPNIVIASSLLSLLIAVIAARQLARRSPGVVIPLLFALSAGLQILEWLIYQSMPGFAALLVYTHMVSLGAVLTSGFWSLVNERFDPRTARRTFSYIAGGGTLGGILGGLSAQAVAQWLPVDAMLPLLACVHLIAGGLAYAIRTSGVAAQQAADAQETLTPLLDLWKETYVRQLALLVLLGTFAAFLLDYVYKARAYEHFGKGQPLLQFFALFNSAVGVGTFLLQMILGRIALDKLGMSGTIGTLPLAVTAGSGALMAVPGLGGAVFARFSEAVFRGSLFRAGYEVLYAPMPKVEKRSVKAIVDVGFDRLGDALGSLLVRGLLPLGADFVLKLLPALAGAVALGTFLLALRLKHAYFETLKRSLVRSARDLPELAAGTQMSLMAWTLPRIPEFPEAEVPAEVAQARSPAREPVDPLIMRIRALRSGRVEEVRSVLRSPLPLDPVLAGHVIPLLAWQEVYHDAIQMLRQWGARITGQLGDALLDLDQDFAIRRRVPKVLAAIPTERSVAILRRGLSDPRFEVRFQCGLALASIQRTDPNLCLTPEEALAAVRREVAVGASVWESHRLLDKLDDTQEIPLIDSYLRERTSRSLQHVFTLLSFAFPREPLQIAFRGVHMEDPQLRGTALEYLDSILPDDIQEKLFPYLEGHSHDRPKRPAMSREELLEKLLLSSESMLLHLQRLQDSNGSDLGKTEE